MVIIIGECSVLIRLKMKSVLVSRIIGGSEVVISRVRCLLGVIWFCSSVSLFLVIDLILC